MHFFRRFTTGRQLADEKSEPDVPVNQENAFVTPENQQHGHLQDRLLRAPPRVLPRGPARRRHFSDNSTHAIVVRNQQQPQRQGQLQPQRQGQQQQANQNGDQRQPSGHSFGHLIARSVLEFTSGYPNTRANQRRLLQTKSVSSNEILSSANPMGFPNKFYHAGRPSKFDAVMRMPPLSEVEVEKHAWNPQDRSLNIFVKEDDPLTLHRHPVAQSTDCARGKVGYSRGFHVWQLTWPTSQRGTHPMVGVATKEAPLQKAGYTSLVGSNCESYGLDLNKNKCYHDSLLTRGWTYPNQAFSRTRSNFKFPDTFYCILDMDEGFMAFATQDQYLGVAFEGLKGKTVFPIVSAVWGHCEIKLQYIGGLEPIPRQLMDACRRTIRAHVSTNRASELCLPPRLQQYLVYKW